MLRTRLIALTAAVAIVGLAGCAAEQGMAGGGTAPPPASQRTAAAAPAAMTMQPGQRMQLGPMLGDRRVRMVMLSEDGNTIDVVFDNADPRQRTQSARVLRLENVNGMLEVAYDTTMPTMPVGTRGRVRRVENTGGMIEIVYGR